MKKTSTLFLSLVSLAFSANVSAIDLNIATVNNAHMMEMKALTPAFEKDNPDIKLKWHIYNEGSLRMRAIADIASAGGRYDVVTIGLYETPIWAKRDWLIPLSPDNNYDVNDLLPSIKAGLSYQGELYAAPFYGESSMLMYRKDILDKANISFNKRPNWTDIQNAAKAVHDPDNEVYGICLRGKPGWGDNMALVSTIANSFGGRWFDMDWQPEINTNAWKKAVNFYVELLNNYGPPNPEKNSFTEILSLSRQGKCAMWVDASIAASFLTDSKQSKYASLWSYTEAPYQITTSGASWLWSWALAIPKESKNVDAAKTFISWATSKDYIKRIADKNGWANVPTGTRLSTYNNPDYVKAVGDFAKAELTALNGIDPENNTLYPSPYSSVQFVTIPEFVSIAGFAGQKIAEALEGKISVEQALDSAQKIAEREMRRANH
ncbi:sugar ABC transporter substrate-binding protein [uncultured Psychromonas sp.]|uniref:ABC transporter substrate-binding protein n=1 Tax=uncultured Psychromonas sp. TaxID=173974 RepID=UPI0026191B19|nr:sugar ABC transporter substrate-binding protein [uncultured Psychromonas sp.]